jgi:regulator of sigma E protease
MYGEQVGEEVSAEAQALSFSHKTVGQRFAIVFAGPLFNLLFALFAFWLIFAVAGQPNLVDSTVIGEVSPGSVAEHAGLRQGDLILSINEKEMISWNQVSEAIRDSGGQAVRLEIQRDRERLLIEAIPVMDTIKNFFGEEVGQRYLLGISRTEELVYEQVSSFQAVQLAFVQSRALVELTIQGIVKMLQRIIPASELGGPLLIAELTGQQYQKGWIDLLYFMGLLSINLAILNLLPIPVLDGGHLVFLTIERILGRPLSEEAMIRAQQVGLALLGTLMLFVFYNDIARLVQRFAVP